MGKKRVGCLGITMHQFIMVCPSGQIWREAKMRFQQLECGVGSSEICIAGGVDGLKSDLRQGAFVRASHVGDSWLVGLEGWCL